MNGVQTIPARYGMTVPLGGIPLVKQRDLVAEMADLGYTDLWTGEADAHDAFTPLALASQWAPGLRLGTAIVPAFTRGPLVIAQSAAAPVPSGLPPRSLTTTLAPRRPSSRA